MKYLFKITQQPYLSIYLFVYLYSAVAYIWSVFNTRYFHVNFFDDDVVLSLWGLGALFFALVLSFFLSLVKRKSVVLFLLLAGALILALLILGSYLEPSTGLPIKLI